MSDTVPIVACIACGTKVGLAYLGEMAWVCRSCAALCKDIEDRAAAVPSEAVDAVG